MMDDQANELQWVTPFDDAPNRKKPKDLVNMETVVEMRRKATVHPQVAMMDMMHPRLKSTERADGKCKSNWLAG